MRKLYLVKNGKTKDVMESLSKTPLSYRSVDIDSGKLILVYDSFRSEAFCQRQLKPLGAKEVNLTMLPVNKVQKIYDVTYETGGVLTDQLRPILEHGVNIYVDRKNTPHQLRIDGDEEDITFFLKDNTDYLKVLEKPSGE